MTTTELLEYAEKVARGLAPRDVPLLREAYAVLQRGAMKEFYFPPREFNALVKVNLERYFNVHERKPEAWVQAARMTFADLEAHQEAAMHGCV